MVIIIRKCIFTFFCNSVSLIVKTLYLYFRFHANYFLIRLKILRKLADNQCSSITKGSIYHIKNMYIQLFDGRTNGWTDGWMDGRTDGWMSGWMSGWMGWEGMDGMGGDGWDGMGWDLMACDGMGWDGRTDGYTIYG